MGQLDEKEEEIEELIVEQQHHHKLVRKPKKESVQYIIYCTELLKRILINPAFVKRKLGLCNRLVSVRR